MLHIDFGMILGENPAFKTPRFSLSAGQEAAFRKVGIWAFFGMLKKPFFEESPKYPDGVVAKG